jgi:UDP:flavonoid glycosyltransferase YjiC (YdhE family)
MGVDLPLDIIIEGLKGSEFRVVATAPTHLHPRSIPENVRVERYLPHGPLIRRAACVVCHGGAGIVQKALASGVPVVAIPTGYDRADVAMRVEVAHVGVRLPLHRVSPDRVLWAVREAIECRPAAVRLSSAFEAAGGAPRAAELLQRLIGHGAQRIGALG